MAKIKDLAIISAVTLFSTFIVWGFTGIDVIRRNFDGPYFAVVANSWYSFDRIRLAFSFPLPLEYYAAHFPLYPALMRLAAPVFSGKLLDAGMAVTLLSTLISAIVLYLIAHRLKWPQPLFVSLVWLFMWPRIWAVRSIASPETLFILAIIGSLFFFETKRYWLAGVAGALATLTKSPGVILFAAYGLWSIDQYIKTKKINWQIYPVLLIPLALVALFGFYFRQTGDFLAYFHSGDNIHLQLLPFKVFDSSQPWVGDFWLEDVLWIYLVGGIGVWRALQKKSVFGWFGLVFYSTILFVSHRDISRYSLPLVPVVLFGLSEILAKKEVRWGLMLLIIPSLFYTLNFLAHNTVAISNWAPFVMSSR
ncbi:MAG: hypothetical protein Q7S31_03640 [bacterium]|nr:hypothetical protein [bacterium]